MVSKLLPIVNRGKIFMSKPFMCPPELLGQDLHGRVAVVTGANSGIGRTTAEQLARQGAEVVLGVRRLAEGQVAAQGIIDAAPGARVEVRELDLGDLTSVRCFAAAFLAEHERLDFLINNAGVMNTPKGKTKDGFELQLGVNHLGHFLLTELLTPCLVASAPARVVNVSSCYHDRAMGRDGDIHFDDLFFERQKYDGWRAYAQSKLANLLHARELARRLAGTSVTAVSVHPGWVRTNLMRHSMPAWLQAGMAPILRAFGMIEPWEGAQSTLYATLSPEVPAQAGAFFSQTGIYRDRALNRGGWPLQSPNPNAHDDAKARRLWEMSEELVGLVEASQAA
jgi:NAD(P)-dependent dehydrogenase (short-subunit alcohol dehydrogenase family)